MMTSKSIIHTLLVSLSTGVQNCPPPKVALTVLCLVAGLMSFSGPTLAGERSIVVVRSAIIVEDVSPRSPRKLSSSERIERILRNRGFKVLRLRPQNNRPLTSLLNESMQRFGRNPNELLLVYFLGSGIVDGDRLIYGSSASGNRVTDYLRIISRHRGPKFAVFDVCIRAGKGVDDRSIQKRIGRDISREWNDRKFERMFLFLSNSRSSSLQNRKGCLSIEPLFVKEVDRSFANLVQIFTNIRNRIYRQSKGRQLPTIFSTVRGDVILR